MPGLASGEQYSHQRPNRGPALPQKHAAVRPAGQPAAGRLMGVANSLALPSLDCVATVYQFHGGDDTAIGLARRLVELDVGVPEDWTAAGHDPTKFVGVTMSRWIEDHGGEAIRRRFGLEATLSGFLDEYSERGEGNAADNQLYLTIQSHTAAYVVLGPTLKLLDAQHPRLAVSFFETFVNALNRWLSIYGYRDAGDRVETLREWIEGEADEDEYEIPNVEECIPACLKQKVLGWQQMAEVVSRVQGREVRELVNGVLELTTISEGAERPVLSEGAREQLFDCNPPWPSLLAVIKENDAVEGCFNDEMENWPEHLPEPSLIIPFDGRDSASVQGAFNVFGVACRTIAAASRLIDLMPGNEQWTTDK
jgi:hypothetical protein